MATMGGRRSLNEYGGSPMGAPRVGPGPAGGGRRSIGGGPGNGSTMMAPASAAMPPAGPGLTGDPAAATNPANMQAMLGQDAQGVPPDMLALLQSLMKGQG